LASKISLRSPLPQAINSWENKVFFGLYEKIQEVLKIFLKKSKNYLGD
jgi:hypothetical protein